MVSGLNQSSLNFQSLKKIWKLVWTKMSMLRRWYYCHENRITSYKSVEIGAFRILKEISSIIN